jgi:hypothetical protein
MNSLKRIKGDNKAELIRRSLKHAQSICGHYPHLKSASAELANAWESGYRAALADIRKEMAVFRTEPPIPAICNPEPMSKEELEFHKRNGTITE